jgi:hypothetical protein
MRSETCQDIVIPSMPYRTLAQSMADNAERHLRNASRHMLVGRYDYAMGSLTKAARNFKRSQELSMPMAWLFG